jgi:hypothetical protein
MDSRFRGNDGRTVATDVTGIDHPMFVAAPRKQGFGA